MGMFSGTAKFFENMVDRADVIKKAPGYAKRMEQNIRGVEETGIVPYGDTVLHSNEAIDPPGLGRKVFGHAKTEFERYRAAAQGAADERIVGSAGLSEKVGPAGENGYSNTQRLKSLAYHQDGSLATKRIAGVAAGTGLAAYAGVNVPYRAISGGSLTRDSDGNFDIAGLPII